MKKLALATAALRSWRFPPWPSRWKSGGGLDEAVKEAKARNVPIMLGLHKDG